MSFELASLVGWMERFLWPLLRVSALLVAAPVLGGRNAPARIRMGLAVTLSALLALTLPVPPQLSLFGAAWWLAVICQVLMGLMIGFTLQIVFEAVVLGAEMISSSAGLSFAQLTDPLRGVQSAVLGQFAMILIVLLFLAMDGHLALIRLLVESFHGVPVGAGLPDMMIGEVIMFSARMFSGALAVALPAVGALLAVYLAFGVVSRAAPTLNLFAVGFPAALIATLLILHITLPGFGDQFAVLLLEAISMIRGWWLA
tara:strand:+ start:3246 stop:4016 length:771 start_codon:yes stop_codon:yes gene_type:complete